MSACKGVAFEPSVLGFAGAAGAGITAARQNQGRAGRPLSAVSSRPRADRQVMVLPFHAVLECHCMPSAAPWPKFKQAVFSLSYVQQ